MDRRAIIAAVAALVVGFGLGWITRSYLLLRASVDAPSWSEGGELGAAGEGASPADGEPAPGEPGADREPGATGEGRVGGETEPGEAGSVAVVGAGGAGSAGAGTSRSGATSEEAASPSGPLDAGAPAVLNAESIREAVSEHRDELGFCFAWQLHQHPELGGRITMEFEIGGEGRVISAQVADDTVNDETVARCFVRVTERMEFPPPEGDDTVTVRYPFELRATDEEE